MGARPRPTISGDGQKRVSSRVEFRIAFHDAVHVLHWHLFDQRCAHGEEGAERFEQKTEQQLRRVVNEDLWLHGTVAFEREGQDEDDEYYERALELARRAYPGLE